MNRDTLRDKSNDPLRAGARARHHDLLADWPVKYTYADTDLRTGTLAGGPKTGWLVKENYDSRSAKRTTG